jgi:hypothetical protein
MCLGLALLAVSLPACQQQPAANQPAGKEPTPTDVATGAEETTASTGDSKKQRGLRIRSDADAYPGRWGLVVPQPVQEGPQQAMAYRELCLALLELGPAEDGSLKGEVLATADAKRMELSIERLAVDGAQIEIDLAAKFDGNPGRMEFRGTLASGLVRGTILEPGSSPMPSYLKPTEESAFDGWDASPIAPGIDTLVDALQQKDQPAAALAAAEELKGNPLSLEAYQSVLSRLPRFPQLDEKQVREIADAYASSAAIWGPRKELEARLQSATAVTSTRKFPALAIDLIQKVADSDAAELEIWNETLKNLRDQAEIDIALDKLRSDDEPQRAIGFAELQERLPLQRYNAEILGRLGEHALKMGKEDLAQEYLADVVALPLLEAMWHQMHAGQPPGDPTPRERLLKLWEDKHGSVDGFDAFIEQTYRRRVEELLDQTKAAGPEPVPADAGNHTVLVELFTGAVCPPCVAGDLALSALRQTYPTSEVVVLQYHQHIPGPDPLTNQDSEDRFGYYSAQGTPAAFVDGAMTPPPGVGGILQHVGQAYSVIRPMVDERMKLSNDVAITTSAVVNDGELTVDVSVAGVPEDQLAKSRLRMAIVEREVTLAAPNGIRAHEFVVREMLGGAKGVGAKSGQLSYSVQMPIAELKQHLVDYLKQFEIGRDVSFPEKPLELKSLSLAAWVQNDQTREVLQTVVAPVTGEIVFPEDKPAEKSDPPASADKADNAP